MTAEPRRDLVDSLLQSCWLLESARARVLSRWDGLFAEEGERAAERAGEIRKALSGHGVRIPEEILGPHTDWLASLVGRTPEEVPLGAPVLQRFGEWSDVYATEFVEDPERFSALGKTELRFPTPPRDMDRAEAYISEVPLPAGRRFVIFTDIHIGAPGREELAKRAVEDINATEPEFVLVPGDITEDGEPQQFLEAKAILDHLEAPVHAVLGNHDAVQRSTKQAAGTEHFRAAFGEPPSDRVIEVDGVQVALVDSTDPEPWPFPDWDLGTGDFRKEPGGVSGGAITDVEARALADRLDPAVPTLVVLHHELQPFAGFPPLMFGVREQDSHGFFEALAGHRLLGILAGHTHRSALAEAGPGVPQLELPALKDWPFCYTIVGVVGSAVHVTVRQISDRDLVWARARKVPPIYTRYVQGPTAALAQSFTA